MEALHHPKIKCTSSFSALLKPGPSPTAYTTRFELPVIVLEGGFLQPYVSPSGRTTTRVRLPWEPSCTLHTESQF